MMKGLSDIPAFTNVSQSRLQSLYSDLSRQRASNPAAFQANVDWWRRVLEFLVSHGRQPDSPDVLVLNADPSLQESLRSERVGKPLGLGAVLTELRHTRALIPLSEFLSSTKSIYDMGSLAYRVASAVVTRPLWWALEQLNLADSADGAGSESDASLWRKVKGPHVVLRTLEGAADVIVERMRERAGFSPAEALYSFDTFRREFGKLGAVLLDVALSETDVKVLVKYLERDRRVIVTGKGVIKFLNPDSAHASREISAVDEGVLELKNAVENMEAQVEELQKRLAGRSEKITENLRAQRQEVALVHLKARKQLEEVLKKRLGSLEILQSTLVQVETAAEDIQIMKQYESSTAILRALLAHPSLQRTHVDATLEALAEATTDARELDETIRVGGDVALGVDAAADEAELERELAGLVEEARREEEAVKRETAAEEERVKEGKVQALPGVPQKVGEDAAAEPDRERVHVAAGTS